MVNVTFFVFNNHYRNEPKLVSVEITKMDIGSVVIGLILTLNWAGAE